MRKRNNKVNELVQDRETKAVELFLKLYPSATIIQSHVRGKDILREYRNFLFWFDAVGKALMGGQPTDTYTPDGNHINFKYQFPVGTDNRPIGLIHIFQYFWDKKND